jgi:formamidopyrimidine-DNA glycosylase
MIEIPEAIVLASQLTDELAGKSVSSVEAGHSPHKFAWYYGEPERYPQLAVGAVIDSARPIGGYVQIQAGDLRLLFSEGTNLRVQPPGSDPPKKRQLLVGFSDGSALSVAVQMYGGMGVFPDGELDNPYYRGAMEKPSPLSREFDEQYFAGILDAPGAEKLSAKALLATEQRIPGLGNGVLQDILFEARIHPKTKVRSLDGERRSRMYEAVSTKLREMADQGGRDTELDLFGNPGGYTTLMSRNTVGSPCTVCGEEIQKAAYMGGSVYYCPGCQVV